GVDVNNKFLNNAKTDLTVIDPQLGDVKLEMVQTAPGRYVAEFDTPLTGAYHLKLTQRTGPTDKDPILYEQTRGLMVGYPDELRLRPTNVELLEALARVSGGKYDPQPEAIFAASEQNARRPTPLWPYLVTAAALLFLLDVALRRIDFTLVLGRWLPKQFVMASSTFRG